MPLASVKPTDLPSAIAALPTTQRAARMSCFGPDLTAMQPVSRTRTLFSTWDTSPPAVISSLLASVLSPPNEHAAAPMAAATPSTTLSRANRMAAVSAPLTPV